CPTRPAPTCLYTLSLHDALPILGTRLVYENPWIAVREDQVMRPDGQPGIYGVVHFKFRAIGVLPVDDRGRIWLVGQYRYTLDRRSEEHTSELQSQSNLVCRLLLE